MGLSPLTNLLAVPTSSGEPVTAAAARAEYLQDELPSRWTCPRSIHLRTSRVSKWCKHARHYKSWGRALRWLREFAAFARAMCTANGVCYHARAMRADDELCCLFLTEVADQMRGVSRVTAARRALSGQRLRDGGGSLNAVQAITLLVDGVRNSQPKIKHQVESLDVNDVHTITTALAKSTLWYERQLAVLIAVGFVTIMRYGELQRVRRDGVRVVMTNGREFTLSELPTLPNPKLVSGLLFHVPWRKSTQHMDAWLPLSCPNTVAALFRHEQTLRSLRCPSHRLFPSVSNRRGRPPSPSNFFGSTQFRDGLRRCLRDFCHMTMDESMVYGGHSLRVGGSNFMRRLGVDPDVHRSLGGWSVLKSARDYMQLSPTEQFRITRRLSVSKLRHVGFADSSTARVVLPQTQHIAISG